jgi:3-oxoacyl-[acyl-carrier-protein] synthase I
VPIAVLGTGLLTSVGLSAPASCAAIRARISNPSETRFIDSDGEWIMAHQVTLRRPWRGRAKLVRMAAFAIAECLGEVDEREWSRIPLILCVAERERPCRLSGLDDELLVEVQRELGVEFSPESAVIPHGRVGAAIALRSARGLIASRQAKHVLIAAADSLVSWPTLSAYERQQRLLTPANSNGFIPGEGAGALLIGDVTGEARVICSGLGFAEEPAHINSEEPLRAGGLTRAIGGALEEAGLKMHELDFRITMLLVSSTTSRKPRWRFRGFCARAKKNSTFGIQPNVLASVGRSRGSSLLSLRLSRARNHIQKAIAYFATPQTTTACVQLPFFTARHIDVESGIRQHDGSFLQGCKRENHLRIS